MCSALRTATMQCAEGFCEEGKAWGGQVHLVCVCVCVCAFGSKSTPTVSPSHTHTHTHTHINGLYEVESKYSVSQHGYANCRQRDHLVTDECTHNTTFASSGSTLIVVHCPKKMPNHVQTATVCVSSLQSIYHRTGYTSHTGQSIAGNSTPIAPG